MGLVAVSDPFTEDLTCQATDQKKRLHEIWNQNTMPARSNNKQMFYQWNVKFEARTFLITILNLKFVIIRIFTKSILLFILLQQWAFSNLFYENGRSQREKWACPKMFFRGLRPGPPRSFRLRRKELPLCAFCVEHDLTSWPCFATDVIWHHKNESLLRGRKTLAFVKKWNM